MFFRQRAGEHGALAYFFGCGSQGVAIAVDVVAGDEDWFIEEAAKANVQIRYVADTHIHADHLSGGRSLAARCGALYCLHASNRELARFEFHALEDGQILELGNVTVRVLHTPGHTPDGICLLVSDKRRTEAPWFVITGDTLFVGAVGRPDLLGREAEMAAQLFESLHVKLLTLADDTEIYPGHQAGSVCGAGISGKPSSTIGFERRWNPALAMTDRDAFVAHVLRNIPPRPAEMERILAANLAA